MRSPISSRLIEHGRVPLHRNAYALILNSGLVAILGVAYWALAARLFPPADLGIGSALISLITFLSGIAQLNLRPGLARFVPVAGPDTARLVAGAYLASAAAGLVIGIIFLIGLSNWPENQGSNHPLSEPALATTFVVAIVLWTVFALQDGVLIGLGRSPWIPIENGLFSAFKLLLLVLLAGWAAVPGILASWMGSMLLAVIAVNVLLFMHVLPSHAAQARPRTPKVRTTWLLRFLAGDYVASLFNLAYVTLPPIVVVLFAGPEAAGYFYVVWVIATALQIVPRQLVTSLTVESARSPADLAGHVRSVLVQITRLVALPCAAVAAFGPLILGVFGAGYAEAGAIPLAILAVAVIPYSINTLANGVSRVRAAARQIIGIESALAVTIMGLSLLLVGQWGSIGVAGAWLVGQVLVALPAYVLRIRPVLRQTSMDQGTNS